MANKVDLADLQAFIAAAQLTSFRAAADAMHISQSGLSRRINKLEIALGVRLFDRVARKVELTAVGRDLARKARVVLDDLDAVLLGMLEVGRSANAQVTLACIPSMVHYFVPAVLKQYHASFPGVVVRIIDEGANAVLAAVVNGEADLGLNFIGTDEPAIEFEPLFTESFIVACRRDHALAQQSEVTWQELMQHDFMTIDKSSGNRLVMDLALAGMRDRPRPAFETHHVSTLVSFVESGLGVATVPRSAMPPEEHPVLVSVPLNSPEVTRTVGVIRKRGHTLSPLAERFHQLLRTAWRK